MELFSLKNGFSFINWSIFSKSWLVKVAYDTRNDCLGNNSMTPIIYQTSWKDVQVLKIKLLKSFQTKEILIWSNEGWVLIFSTKVFEVWMLINCKTKEYLIVNIDLLFMIVMRIQRLNSFIHNLNSSFFCCFHKVKIDLCVSSISLNPFVNSPSWKFFACLELLIPISLVFLINSKDRWWLSTQGLLD